MSAGNHPNSENDTRRRAWVIAVCVALLILSIAVYWQVTGHEFINFDDDIYVTENRHIQDGLTAEGIAWAFSFDKRGTYWHPLTWLSHMLDCQFFGLNAGMHHLTNLALHCVNVLLLFALLFRTTGALWRSAFAAAFFAVHPINVDSVAWIAERKNLLSTFFWMLTMMAYVWYAMSPGIVRYSITLAVFCLGLLAKPMLVTLPFVFLLLDWWPLGRLRIGTVKASGTGDSHYVESDITRLVFEKVPFLFLSILSIAMSSSSLTGNVISFAHVPLDLRIANAVVSYVKYLGKLLWPHNLAIYYPFPSAMVPWWQIAGSLLLLVGISAVSLYYWKRRSWLITGWFWFLGTLVPVIGLMQGGLWPAMADRWAYVPFIGLYILISWGLFDLFGRLRYRRIVLGLGAAVILIAFAAVSNVQVGYWENNFTLFSHAIDVTRDNDIAHYNLGKSYHDAGNLDAAFKHYSESLRINPQYLRARVNFGVILEKKGKPEKAKEQYGKALALNPSDVDAHNNMGAVLYGQGRIDEAVRHYTEALRIDPSYVKSYNNMGIALFGKGKYGEAIEYFKNALKINSDYEMARENLDKAVKIRAAIAQSAAITEMRSTLMKDPDNADMQIRLGDLYWQAGAIANARQHYMTALSLNPGIATELRRQAAACVSQRNYGKALSYLRRLVQLNPDNPDGYYNIACVLALDDKKEAALGWLKKAIGKGFKNIALMKTDPDLANIRNSASFNELVDSMCE